MTIHNHGAEERPGLSCNEIRLEYGAVIGVCMASAYMKECNENGCGEKFLPTRDGRDQAWRDGWYLQKWDGPAWCPNHIPVWVPSDFKRKG